MLSPAMPVYFLPWDIVMYQIQPWKTDGDVLTYAHACPSEEPRSKSNHTSRETGKLSTRSGLPCLPSYEQLGSMQMAEARCFARMPTRRAAPQHHDATVSPASAAAHTPPQP